MARLPPYERVESVLADEIADGSLLPETQLPPEDDLRRCGTVPHSGLGFERALGNVTGLANERNAMAFPRTAGNARY